MREVYMTRTDKDVGVGEFDSIQWIFETHIKEPDTKEFHYAVLCGHNENSPVRIELWRTEPNYNTPPDRVWTSSQTEQE